jgi:PAS domain S-box-containing protein
MKLRKKSRIELLVEIDDLQARLTETTEALRAPRGGEVDPLVTSGPGDEYSQISKGADPTYRILVEAIEEGAFTLSQDGTILYSNNRFAEMLRRPLEQVVDSSILEHLVADEEVRIQGFLGETENCGIKTEVMFRAEDGAQVPLHASVSSFRTPETSGLCVTVSDMSECKRQEERILFQACLLDQVRNAVIATDLHGVITYWNDFAGVVYQWSAAEVMGKYVVDIIVPKSERSRVVAGFKSLDHDVYWQGELSLQRKDASIIPVDIHVSSITNAEGTVIGFVAVTVDITERKRAQEQLLANSKHLEEVNAALNVLLRHRDEEKKELHAGIFANVKQLIMPYLNRLKQSSLNHDQMTHLGILEGHLQEIVSPFTKNLSQEFFKLSAMEMQVADLVKAGNSNQEIADILGLAKNTILVHRHRIRTKLGLRNNKTNLRSYLQSLG